MSRLMAGATLASLLIFPLNVHAFGWHFRSPAVSVQYYAGPPVLLVPTVPAMEYTPAPLYAAPSTPVCTPAVQQPSQAAPPYAPPVSAPSSPSPAGPGTQAEPPLKPSSPSSESHYFDAYLVAPRASDSPPGERCLVSFWNLSERELTLKVDGQARVLPRGKSVQLELAREFVWHADDREVQTQHIPPNESALNIVIRR